MKYNAFLQSKQHSSEYYGFDPLWMPDKVIDFQEHLITWALQKGRSALFEDCGLGKTLQQLAWAENVVRKTNGRVLVLTPLAVSGQTVKEGDKFGIECHKSKGELSGKIVVTNYEKLHLFDWKDFQGCVCDESSILKNFDGQTKSAVTDFMRKLPYRLLCTATPSPNDYIELGTSSEALGVLGYIDMLQKFFKAADGTYAQGGKPGMGRFDKNPFNGKFRFRGHSEHDFWRWVCSWSRAIRKPSDCGFDDGEFVLPELEVRQHVVSAITKREGFLFDMPAVTLQEQREERRRTLTERCEQAAELVMAHDKAAVSWCSLNDEGNLLERLIDGAVQVSGSDSDERKEEVFESFSSGQIKRLVTKPVIGGFGMNWQHCAHQTFFPSHSYEQYYQAVRRSLRFGQKSKVRVDLITSEGETRTLENMLRKDRQAEQMFEKLVRLMNDELLIKKENKYTKNPEAPSWL